MTLAVSCLLVTVGNVSGAGGDDFRYLVSLKTRTFIPAPADYAAGLDYMTRQQGEGAVHMMVQMNDVPGEAARLSLADRGLLLQGYLPERTWYALVSTSLTSTDLQAMGVRWLAPLQREDKISARLLQGEYGAWTEYEHGWRIYAVQFHDDVTQSQAESELHGIVMQEGGWIKSIHTLILAMDPSQVDAVAQLDVVKYVEQRPPALTQVNDGIRQALSVNTLMGAPYNLSGQGSKVLEYDAGLADRTHPDFSGRVVWGENGGVIQHSTHVAGTIAGNGQQSGGQYAGMAPQASVRSYEYESCNPYCLYNSPQDIEQNYSDGLNNYQMDLATNSIGSNIAPNGYPCDWEGDYEHTAQLLDAISTGSLGVPFLSCWAAGNERAYGRCGTQYNTTGVPATAKDIIAVGATNSNDHSMTYFSSWGPVDDGRIRPDICAPGCQNGGDGGITSTSPGGGYATLCGTSMATPATAGCLADILEQYHAISGLPPRPLPSTMKALLINTAHDYGNPGPDFQFGYGEIRPVDAVDALRNGLVLQEGTIDNGGEDVYDVTVPFGQFELRVTLAWDDPPGQYLAQRELVNDLDLTVESPTGGSLLPWVLNPASPGTPATRGADHVNPVEQVVVTLPMGGTWHIHVAGTQIPQGPQSYSLVANVHLVDISAVSHDQKPSIGIGGLSSYPNPFSPRTTIRFETDGKAPVSLLVFDAAGRQVRTLLNNEPRQAGTQFVTWDGKDDAGRQLDSGAYFYQVVSGGRAAGDKVLMVR